MGGRMHWRPVRPALNRDIFLGLGSVTVFLLISYYVKDADSVRLQKITLYANDGVTENYTSDVADLAKVSHIIQTNQLESICSQVGVWAFFTSPKYTDSSRSYGYHPATPPWSCNERRVSAYMTPYKSIRHLGNLDLNESGISLFSEPLFAEDEIYFDGDALSLPAPFNMNSFGFTGADNWTIFSNPNFSGDAVCLCSENNEFAGGVANNYNENSGSGTSGVTFEERLSFSVGSLRKSCYGSQVWLVNGEFIRPQEVLNSSVISAGENLGGTQAYLDSLPALKLQPASHNFEPPLTVAGQELNLPFTIKFSNFTAQLGSAWRIYAKVGFCGNFICIRGSGVFNNTARIGSIRAGCNDTEEMDEYSSSTSTSRYDYETTTDVEYDVTIMRQYSDYDNSIEHGSQRQQGNRKEFGRVTSTFSVTDVDNVPDSGNGNFGTTGFDESLDGLPTTPRYRGTTPISSYPSRRPTPIPESVNSYTNIYGNTPVTSTPSVQTPGTPGSDRASYGRNLRPSIISTSTSTSISTDEINSTTSTRKGSSAINTAEESIKQFYNSTSASIRNQTQQRRERISTADTNSIFFTAFIITLILLLLCIILAIGVFLYFRSTRKGSGEVKPTPSSAQAEMRSRSPEST